LNLLFEHLLPAPLLMETGSGLNHLMKLFLAKLILVILLISTEIFILMLLASNTLG